MNCCTDKAPPEAIIAWTHKIYDAFKMNAGSDVLVVPGTDENTIIGSTGWPLGACAPRVRVCVHAHVCALIRSLEACSLPSARRSARLRQVASQGVSLEIFWCVRCHLGNLILAEMPAAVHAELPPLPSFVHAYKRRRLLRYFDSVRSNL